MVRNEMFQRRLTERLIEIGTDGQGAVLNGYVAPEPSLDTNADILEVDGEVVDDAVGDTTIGPEDAALIEEAVSLATDLAAAESGDAVKTAGYDHAVLGDGSGNVPEGYPIKGNTDSMIYHTPESGSYERTNAELYFATEDDAINAGFRVPANMQRGAESADAAQSLAEAAAEKVAGAGDDEP